MTDITDRLRVIDTSSVETLRDAWAAMLEAADEIERLRSVARHETDAAEAYKAKAESLRDCRTCRHYYQYHAGDCRSTLRCVDGTAYQRAGAVRLWEAK